MTLVAYVVLHEMKESCRKHNIRGRQTPETKPRHRNNMNVNCYKKIMKSQRNKKQVFVKESIRVLPWNCQRQMQLSGWGGLNQVYEYFTSLLFHPSPYKTSSVDT